MCKTMIAHVVDMFIFLSVRVRSWRFHSYSVWAATSSLRSACKDARLFYDGCVSKQLLNHAWCADATPNAVLRVRSKFPTRRCVRMRFLTRLCTWGIDSLHTGVCEDSAPYTYHVWGHDSLHDCMWGASSLHDGVCEESTPYIYYARGVGSLHEHVRRHLLTHQWV